MAYYDALKAQWATLTGTVAEKLAAVNAATVTGPNVDVTVPQVVGYLLLNGAYCRSRRSPRAPRPATRPTTPRSTPRRR